MKRAFLIVLVGCGGGGTAARDAPPSDAPAEVPPPLDASASPDAASGVMVRVYGNINYNGPLSNVRVVTLGAAPQQTVTDANGDFYFDAPEGAPLIMEALPPLGSGLIPMIRGVIAEDHLRPRELYLMGPSDVMAAAPLTETFDPARAIVEVDFRNAAIGGYGVTMTGSGSAELDPPPFGLVYDANGDAQFGEQTVTGGDGSTLLLGDLHPGEVFFTPVVPPAATLPCHTDGDAQPLPLVAGVTTWFDFECGSATD